jgi:hypothetical protein
MTSQSMTRLLTKTASTKRAAVVSGKRGTPAAYLVGVKCMPIDPVSIGETRDRMQSQGVDAPIALYQTVCSGDYDIIKGDTFTCDSVDYYVKDVEAWGIETAYLGSAYNRLVLEKVKP